MAQEAFLRAFTRLHQWRDDAKFSTWLYAVALNVFRSATRRDAMQELPLEKGDGAFVSSDPLKGSRLGSWKRWSDGWCVRFRADIGRR